MLYVCKRVIAASRQYAPVHNTSHCWRSPIVDPGVEKNRFFFFLFCNMTVVEPKSSPARSLDDFCYKHILLCRPFIMTWRWDKLVFFSPILCANPCHPVIIFHFFFKRIKYTVRRLIKKYDVCVWYLFYYYRRIQATKLHIYGRPGI